MSKDTSFRVYFILALALLTALIPSALVVKAQPATTTLTIGMLTSSPYTSLASINGNQFGPSSMALGGFSGLVELPMFFINISSPNALFQIIPVLLENVTISPPNWAQLKQEGKLTLVNITVQINPNFKWANGQPVTIYDLIGEYAVFLVENHVFPPKYLPVKFVAINNYTGTIVWPPYLLSPVTPALSLESMLGFTGHSLAVNAKYFQPIINLTLANLAAIDNGTANITALDVKALQYNPVAVYGTGVIPALFNGPYYPVSITPSEIVLAKNPYYPYANALPWNQIIIYQFTSISALISAIDSGQIDFVDPEFAYLYPSLLSQIPSYYTVVTTPTPYSEGILFNFKNPWLSNILVRQAIAYVLNRTAIAQSGGLQGFYPVSYPDILPNFTAWPSIYNWYATHGANPYPTNWTKAAQLLEQAGFTYKNGQWYTPNGTPFTIRFVYFTTGTSSYGSSPSFASMAETIVSELESFGISVQFSTVTSPSLVDQMMLTGNGYDIFFPAEDGGVYGGEYDWGHEIAGLLEIWNASHYNWAATPYNGSTYNLADTYLLTQTAANYSQWLFGERITGMVLNTFLPFLDLVGVNYISIYNSQVVQAPPANSWLWPQLVFETWSDIGFNVPAFGWGMIHPVGYTATTTVPIPAPITISNSTTSTSTSTVTTTTTSTSSLVSTSTVTTSTSTVTSTSFSTLVSTVVSTVSTMSTAAYAIIGVLVVIIVVLIALLVTRRR